MNPITAYLLIGSLYLVIIAYGVVRTRKRRLPVQLRIVSAALQVAVPPAAIAALLAYGADARTFSTWLPLLGLMALAGFFLALCTDIVARRMM